MSSVRSRSRDRITVKVHNMKRSTSRDSPPPPRKRRSISRGSSISPDRSRRRTARSPSYEYGRSHRELPPPERSHSYKVLCVSAIHSKASDEFIKETLFREYKKFGDFSIRISHEYDEKVAYVCFRTAEDAREARHSKPRIVLYDKVALVEPVYESSSSKSDPYRRPRSTSPPPPEYDRHYYAPRGAPIDKRRLIDPYVHERYGPPVVPPYHPADPYHPLVRHEYIPRGPPLHAPHMYPAPPRHHMPRPYAPRAPRAPPMLDVKKDKFPNYLTHVAPEDDPLATRTLFAGNLEINISDEELKRIFGKYGIVDDIDIKRPPPGTGNAFAFVRYQTLDMAHRAKVELSGQYIGKFQCKIGYGKATPTTRIWVGGLGAWTSVTQLEREFDRFGAIKKIEYNKGDTQAYILYDSIDAATAAVKEMRGFPLGGPERRLRIDFSEVGPTKPYQPKPSSAGAYEDPIEYRRYEYPEGALPYEDPHHFPYIPAYRGRGRGYRGRGVSYRGAYHPHYEARLPPEDHRRLPPDPDYDLHRAPRRSGSHEPGVDRSRSRSPRRRSPDYESDSSARRSGQLSTARTLPEVARKVNTIWHGALILKSSLFPAKFHLTDGDSDIVEGLMKDEDGKNHLRITQRLRLDQPKLDDVQKRIATAASHAIFLGLPGSTSAVQCDDANVQTRPLRNLVSYLKQKEAAGVISLLNKETEATGVLYSFPPCEFSTELLKRTCHNLTEEGLKEDHLVIVVVRA